MTDEDLKGLVEEFGELTSCVVMKVRALAGGEGGSAAFTWSTWGWGGAPASCQER